MNSFAPDKTEIKKNLKGDIQLNVNDQDLYEEANIIRDKNLEEEKEEQEKTRGFRR